MRYIDPKTITSNRFDRNRPRPEWDSAIICFRDRTGSDILVDAFGAKPFGSKVFWGMEESPEYPFVYECEYASKSIGIVSRCIRGGPQAAILVEELSALDVPAVIGFGCAGSISPEISLGTQIVVERALATDGTSRAYTGQGNFFQPDSRLRNRVGGSVPVVAATVDAVYRETRELIAEYRESGAHVVNMESAPFYAAAAACNMAALWVGNVSDVLVEGGKWTGWFGDRSEIDRKTVDIVKKTLDGLSKQGSAPECESTGR